MGGVPVLLFVAVFGINYGWVPDQQGGVEYIIQVEPQELRKVERAGEISSTIPAEVQGHVSKVVVRVGTGPVPRETPPQISLKTNYGSVRSTDAADAASMTAPVMALDAQRSFKPEPEPQFSFPGSRPSTQPQTSTGSQRVEPPRPSTESTSGNWQNDQSGRGFAASTGGTLNRPSTNSSNGAANPFTSGGQSSRNYTSNDSTAGSFGNAFDRGNAALENNLSSGGGTTFGAGARLGAPPRGMDFRGGSDGQRIAEANSNVPPGRSSLDRPFFGPPTRQEAEAAQRTSGQSGTSPIGTFPQVTPNQNASWNAIPNQNREWLASQGWTEQLFEFYRTRGGIFFRDTMPIDIDGYPVNPAMEPVGNKPYTTRAEVLAAHPELQNNLSRNNSFSNSDVDLGNPNTVPSLERENRGSRSPFALQPNDVMRTDERDERFGSESTNGFSSNRGRSPNANFGSTGEDQMNSNSLDRRRPIDRSGFREDQRARESELLDDRLYQDRFSDGRVTDDRRLPTRSASDRIDAAYDDRGFADRSSARSTSSDRSYRDSMDPRDGDYEFDRFPTRNSYPRMGSNRTAAERADQTEARLAGAIDSDRQTRQAEAARALREAEARAVAAEAENERQRADAKTQRLFNALLLASIVGNLYLVYWLKNLRYRFRDMVASKRSPATQMSTVS